MYTQGEEMLKAFFRGAIGGVLGAFLVFLLVQSGHCQNIGNVNSQIRPQYFAEHPLQATQHMLPSDGSTYVAQDERTSGFNAAPEVSLGQFARQYREEHKNAPKAKFVWEGQCISKIVYRKK